MKEVIKLYKNVGETPLECIGRFRQENSSYEEVKMTYLGRLDPMAEGLLLVLAHDTRGKEEFLALDKTYEFEVFWGVSTDTYDVLGLPSQDIVACSRSIGEVAINNILARIKEKKTQKYPPYSSRPASGRPLWQWARAGEISEVDVPTRSIKIFNIEHIHTRQVSGSEVLAEVEQKIGLVNGDFRQATIVAGWEEVLGKRGKEIFLISKFEADVSSGTYIRGLAHEMGEMLGVPALAWSIKRTRVGEYKISNF